MEQKSNQDWRLEINPDGFLSGNTFTHEKFVSTEANDHEHCAFCFKKITDLDIQDSDKEGYTTVYSETGETIWVCKECFNDFKELLNFKLK